MYIYLLENPFIRFWTTVSWKILSRAFFREGRLILAKMNRPHNMEKQTPELRPKTGISHFKACRVQSATFQNVLAYSIGGILWQFISNTSSYLDRCWSRFHDILSYELLLVTLFDQILKIQHPKVTQRCWYPKERGQIVLPRKSNTVQDRDK